MQDNIINMPNGTAQHTRAMELHQYILAQGGIAAHAMSEIGRSLKEMRDQKLYTELGHASFEEYTEQMLGIKQRQAYNYIQVFETYGPKFIDANAGLGVTKLLLLASVPVLDREDFMAEHDVEDMTAKELKEITEKYRAACEQISLLTNEKIQLEEDSETDTDLLRAAQERELAHKAEKTALEKKIKELEARPVDVAVAEPSLDDLTAIRQEAEKAAAEKHKQALADALAKAEKKAKKDTDALVKAAKEEAARAAEERIKTGLRDVERDKAAALERAKELEKKLALGGNADTVIFAHLFEDFQGTYNRMLGIIQKISGADAATADKLRGAMRKVLTAAQDKLGG